MISDGEDGLLVPQKDAAAIAAALRRLLDEPGLARQIGTAARARAVGHFGFRANAARLLGEIRSVSPS